MDKEKLLPIVLIGAGVLLLSVKRSDTGLPFDPHSLIGKGCIKYSRYKPNISKVKRWENIARKYGKKFNVPYKLILAIIATESNGNPNAYRYESHINDASIGLMQILCRTAKTMGLKGSCNKLYEPDTNIKIGTKYLRYLYDRYKNWIDVISAYNAGHPWKYSDYCYGNQEYVNRVVTSLLLL